MFHSAPQFLGGRAIGVGRNSGAQAVLSAPALITSDGLGTRLCLYPAVSVDCHSACSVCTSVYVYL